MGTMARQRDSSAAKGSGTCAAREGGANSLGYSQQAVIGKAAHRYIATIDRL